jgi:integrase
MSREPASRCHDLFSLQVRQHGDRYNEAGPTHTKPGRRTAPLTPKLAAVLRQSKRARRGPVDLVFPNLKGKPENLRTIVNRCHHFPAGK